MNRESGKQVLAQGAFVRLVQQEGWEWAERTNSTGVVAVIALAGDGHLVLTEQYRRPLDARVLDLPMGLSGDLHGARDEELREAARRELLEETGYAAERLEFLLEGPTSAGLTNEMLTFFLARNVRKVGDGGGDESEEIEVCLLPLDGAEAWLNQRCAAGVLLDPKIYTALHFARQFRSD
ncbi:MAG: NUDIX hydrolase [Planctomycetaceae bacterium]|nr:NUDIX hydrolase [Planctomycetaceae bacterium]